MSATSSTSRFSLSQFTDNIADLDSPQTPTSTLSATPPFEDVHRSSHTQVAYNSRIPRPRNSFMIFRCGYSQEHKSTGKRVRRPKGVTKDKSLSKRASEAWHQLSREDRKVFEELARQEAMAHKLKYPDYHFRPSKKGTARKKLASTVQKKPIFDATLVVNRNQVSITRSQSPPSRPLSSYHLSSHQSPPSRSFDVGKSQHTQPVWDVQSPTLSMACSGSLLNFEPDDAQLTARSSPANEVQCCDPKIFEPMSEYCILDEAFSATVSESQNTLQQQYFSSTNSSNGSSPYPTPGTSSCWDSSMETIADGDSYWTSPQTFGQPCVKNSYFPTVDLGVGSAKPPVYDLAGAPTIASEFQVTSMQAAASDPRVASLAPATTAYYSPQSNFFGENHGVVWLCSDQNGTSTEWPLWAYPDILYTCKA